MTFFKRPKHFFVFPILCFWFIFFLFQLHGYSISEWSRILSVPGPIQWGESRAIRSDDYGAMLPIALSQKENHFSIINPFIAYGQNVNFSSYPTPVKDWTALFRMESWGYYFSPDYGMSWSWSVKLFGALLMFYLFFRICAPDSEDILSLLGAVFLLYSPMFQMWSLFMVPYILYSLGSVLALSKSMQSDTKIRSILFAALFMWFAFSFVLTTYPPMQIICIYFSIILTIFFNPWILIKRPKNLIAGFFSLIGLLSLVFIYFKQNSDVINTLKNTVYPGQRFTLGGNGNYFSLFKNNLVSVSRPPLDKRFGGNICEAAGFVNLSPILLIYLFKFKALPKNFKFLLANTLVFSTLILFWYFYGLPAMLDQLTGFSRMTENRTIYFISFLNLITISFTLKFPIKLRPIEVFGVLIGWLFLHVFPMRILFQDNFSLLAAMIPYFGILTVALILLFSNRMLWGMGLLAILSLYQTFTFNPLVKGGYAELFQNSEIEKIRSAVGNANIVVNDESVLGNLPRIIGLHGLSGLYYYPQTELWKRIDPSGTSKNAWNRYGFVIWKLHDSGLSVKITSPVADVVQIESSTKDPILDLLDIKYILSSKSKPLSGLITAAETSCCTLYKIK